jgi:hypothetical protein
MDGKGGHESTDLRYGEQRNEQCVYQRWSAPKCGWQSHQYVQSQKFGSICIAWSEIYDRYTYHLLMFNQDLKEEKNNHEIE